MTDGSILTGVTGTLINIHLTVEAVKPKRTLARVHGNQVLAGGSIKTWIGLTLVYFNLTVASYGRGESVTALMANVYSGRSVTFL